MANRFLNNIRINDAYTFPASDGNDGQVITTDGAGNLAFENVSPDAASVIYRDNFTGDGSTVTFDLQNSITDEDQTQIYIDGVYQEKSTYSISGTTITFTTAPILGHSVEVISISSINTGPTVLYQDNFTGNGNDTAFTLGQIIDNEIKTFIFLNGVYQFKNTYTVDGTTLTFDTAPANGVAIEVVSIASAVQSDSLEAGSVIIPVKNTHTASISKGTPVYITGNVGASERLQIAPADASNSAKMPAAGLLLTTLAVNAEGYVITGGYLRNLTTDTIDGTSTSSNDTVYVKAGGGLTMTKPTGSNLIQNIAKVARSASGNSGSLIVSSILRTNDIPNLTTGKIWVGSANNTIESGTLHLDESNNRLGINNNSPSYSLDVTGDANISSNVIVGGNLTVQGTETILNTQTVEVEDNILQLNTTQGSPDTATATTSGISIYRGSGVTQASFIFDDADDTWDLTNNLVVAGDVTIGGKTYPKISLTDNQGVPRTFSIGTNNETFTIRNETGSSDAFTISNSNIAIFAGNVGVGGKTPTYGLNLAQGTGASSKIAWTDGTPNFAASIYANSSNDKLTFATKNASNVETTALEIDSSQNATFAGTITAAGGSSNNNDDANILTLNASEHARLLVDTSSTSGHRATLALESNGNELILTTTGSASELTSVGNLTVTSSATTFTGALNIDEYIYHTGDTNTYIRVLPDEWVFRTGGDDRLTISNSNTYFTSTNVGIKNTVASAIDSASGLGTLVVGDGGASSQGITIYTGTATYGALNFADATSGTGAYQGYIKFDHTNNSFGHYIGNVERMRIAGTLITFPTVTELRGDISSSKFAIGNMGDYASQMMISSRGFLTFNVSNTGSALDATERMRIDSTGLVRFTVDNGTASAIDIGYVSSARTIRAVETGGGNARPLTLLAQNFTLKDDSATRMRIDSSGNVIIGATTINSAFGVSNTILTVKGKSSGGEGILQLVGLSNNATDIPGRIEFHSQAEADPMCSIRATRGSADDIGDLSFLTNNGSVPQTRMRIASGGDVGIGVTSPNYKLHVGGDLSADSSFSSYTADGLFNSNARPSIIETPGWDMKMKFGYSDNGGGGYAPRIGFQQTYHATNAPNTTTIKSSIGLESSGNFEIKTGTSNGVSGLVISSTGRIIMPNLDGKTQVHPDVSYRTSDGELFYQTSSERYKTDIVNLESCLNKIDSLRPVRFTDINTNEPGFGLIAEETNEIIPDVVFSKDDQIEGISYSNLTPFLIKAIQELKAEVETLKNQINGIN